jgi:hypothetical protein
MLKTEQQLALIIKDKVVIFSQFLSLIDVSARDASIEPRKEHSVFASQTVANSYFLKCKTYF